MFPLRGGKAFIPALALREGIGREVDIGPLLLAMKNSKNHAVFFILSERRMMRYPTVINYNGGHLIKKPTRADRKIKKSTNSSVLFIVIYSDARHVF